MQPQVKKRWKAAGRYLLIAAAAALLSCFLFYLARGWPVAMGLKEQARRGEIVSVQVTHRGETAALPEESFLLASGVAETLTVSLPGTPTEVRPETEYTFTCSDGTKIRVGIAETKIFRDGKAYSPAGDKDCVTLFLNMTEALFFPERTATEN